jgi:hypothetical protein
MVFEPKLKRRSICIGGNDDQIIVGIGGPGRIVGKEFDRVSAHKIINTLT